MTLKGNTGISLPKPNIVVAAVDRGRLTASNQTTVKRTVMGPSSSNVTGCIHSSRFSVLDVQEDGPMDAETVAIEDELEVEVMGDHSSKEGAMMICYRR